MYPRSQTRASAIPWSPGCGSGDLTWGRELHHLQQVQLLPTSGRPLWLETDKGTVDAVQAIAEARDVSMGRLPWPGCCTIRLSRNDCRGN